MSSRFRSAAVLLVAAGVGFFVCGCGKGRPKLGRVSGTVTFNNTPLPRAMVVFVPDEPGIRSAMGETDEQGRYTLWTYSPGDGAPVGKHKVTVTARGAPEKAELHPSMKAKGKGDAYYEQVAATGKPLIPEKYFMTHTSGLTADVGSGSNTFDFPLSGKPGK